MIGVKRRAALLDWSKLYQAKNKPIPEHIKISEKKIHDDNIIPLKELTSVTIFLTTSEEFL